MNKINPQPILSISAEEFFTALPFINLFSGLTADSIDDIVDGLDQAMARLILHTDDHSTLDDVVGPFFYLRIAREFFKDVSKLQSESK